MDQLIRKLGSNESLSDKSGQSSSSPKKPICKISYLQRCQCETDLEPKSSRRHLRGITKVVTSPEDLEDIFRNTQPTNYQEVSIFDTGYSYNDIKDWELIMQPDKVNMYFLLQQILENQIKTDTQVKVGEMFFNCHLVVLQAYSKFFLDVHQAFVVKLDTDKITSKAFMIVYQWMLSENPVIKRKDILEVFQAASYLRIADLLDQCWYYFEEADNFNENTACVCYIETTDNPAYDVLRCLMLIRVCKFFMVFVATKEFLEMPTKHLTFLLRSNVISVNTEIEVFYAAVHWLEYKWDERRSSTLEVIKSIRFYLMPIWYLAKLTRCTETDILQYIVTLPEMDQFVSAAIAQVTESMFESKSETELSLSPFYDQRCWIQDINCPYHSLVGCPKVNEITFAQFQDYLRYLQLQRKTYWSKQFTEIELEKRVQPSITGRNRSVQIFEVRSEFN